VRLGGAVQRGARTHGRTRREDLRVRRRHVERRGRIEKLHQIHDNYELVPEQHAQPATVFLKVALQLIGDEVPPLAEWARRLAAEIVLKPEAVDAGPPIAPTGGTANITALTGVRVLVLFTGSNRPSNLPAALRRLGADVDAEDLQMGGPSQNVLLASVQRRLRDNVRSKRYSHVFFAPPCKSFSCAHEPQLRSRRDPHAKQDLPDHLSELVAKDDRIVAFVSTQVWHSSRIRSVCTSPSKILPIRSR
jgi:hypothetical protein